MTDLLSVFQQSASRPTIMCDVDNTLAWTTNQAIALLNSVFDTSMTLHDISRYDFSANLPLDQSTWLDKQFGRQVFYKTLAPDYHAIDAINALHDRGYYVVIATSRDSDLYDVTVEWLDEWKVSHDEVLVGSTVKTTFVRSHPPKSVVAIDDNPSTVLDLAKLGAQVYTPMRTYTPSWLKECRMSNVELFSSWDILRSRLP